MPSLQSSAEFARTRDLSPQRVRQLLAANKITGAFRIGGRWAIPADADIHRSLPGRPARSHLGLLRQAARAAEFALAQANVRALVVGSVAFGGAGPDSDLDVLVVSYPGRKWSEVTAIVADAVRRHGVRADVIFADTLPASVRRAMMKDAMRAGDLR